MISRSLNDCRLMFRRYDNDDNDDDVDEIELNAIYFMGTIYSVFDYARTVFDNQKSGGNQRNLLFSGPGDLKCMDIHLRHNAWDCVAMFPRCTATVASYVETIEILSNKI